MVVSNASRNEVRAVEALAAAGITLGGQSQVVRGLPRRMLPGERSIMKYTCEGCGRCSHYHSTIVRSILVLEPGRSRTILLPERGECRKSAPGSKGWPTVLADDKCGEIKISQQSFCISCRYNSVGAFVMEHQGLCLCKFTSYHGRECDDKYAMDGLDGPYRKVDYRRINCIFHSHV